MSEFYTYILVMTRSGNLMEVRKLPITVWKNFITYGASELINKAKSLNADETWQKGSRDFKPGLSDAGHWELSNKL